MIEILKDIGHILKTSIPRRINPQLDLGVLDSLSDTEMDLESRIVRLGLCSDVPEVFPNDFEPYLNTGIKVWQYPNQLAQLFKFIEANNINSYLEVGTYQGGLFIAVTDYLERIGRKVKAASVDILLNPELKNYAKRKGYDFLVMPSESRRFKRYLSNKRFDLALIDGDHSFEGVMGDFMRIKDHAEYIAFHDIVDDNQPGVCEFWKWVKNSGEYQTYEFVNQYTEVSETGKTYLGIGVIRKK